jgi:hypothetical protein
MQRRFYRATALAAQVSLPRARARVARVRARARAGVRVCAREGLGAARNG